MSFSVGRLCARELNSRRLHAYLVALTFDLNKVRGQLFRFVVFFRILRNTFNSGTDRTEFEPPGSGGDVYCDYCTSGEHRSEP